MGWLYDKIEVIIAIVAGIATLITIAFKLGAKITRLDEHTTSGLHDAKVSIDHVSEKVDSLSNTVSELRKSNHDEHAIITEEVKLHRDTLIKHGIKIENLDSRCKSFDKKGTDS